MESSLHTENVNVAYVWVAWQMTLEQVRGRTFKSPEERIEVVRKLFKENLAVVTGGSSS